MGKIEDFYQEKHPYSQKDPNAVFPSQIKQLFVQFKIYLSF